jgi:23S rRNA pseudouridine2604 synthase
MPRPTLKIPAKAASTDAEGEVRAPSHKPARAGFKAPKQSVAQRDSSNAAKAARLAAAAEKPYKTQKTQQTSERPRAAEDAPRTPARPMAPARADARKNKEATQPREAYAPERPKSYPKRGVARSTGARALPPARTDGEPATPRWEAERPTPAPTAATRGAPRPAPRIDGERATPGTPRTPRAPRADYEKSGDAAPRQARPRPTNELKLPPPLKPIPEHLQKRRAAPPAYPGSETGAPRRPPLNEPPRLSKQISEMTQCSRREADEWIENGWVRVDGVVVTALGTRVHPNAKIEIKEEASKHQTESVTILLNKPLDMASGKDENGGEGGESALQLIRPENRWAEDSTRTNFKATHLRGLALAGKLDAESTGMLVFTQEGSVARRIVGDDTRLEKEYMVRVEGELTPEGLKQLNHGLSLDDVKLKKAQVSWQNEQQLRFVLHESKKRQIQRMCELVGLTVTSIKRIRIGSVSLGKLPAGQWRYLREGERF